MGISVESVQGTDESQPIEIEDHDDSNQSNDIIQTVQDNQLDNMTENNQAANFLDNELLMETDGTVIDNL